MDELLGSLDLRSSAFDLYHHLIGKPPALLEGDDGAAAAAYVGDVLAAHADDVLRIGERDLHRSCDLQEMRVEKRVRTGLPHLLLVLLVLFHGWYICCPWEELKISNPCRGAAEAWC